MSESISRVQPHFICLFLNCLPSTTHFQYNLLPFDFWLWIISRWLSSSMLQCPVWTLGNYFDAKVCGNMTQMTLTVNNWVKSLHFLFIIPIIHSAVALLNIESFINLCLDLSNMFLRRKQLYSDLFTNLLEPWTGKLRVSSVCDAGDDAYSQSWRIREILLLTDSLILSSTFSVSPLLAHPRI